MWTEFHDMHSGGRQKLQWARIYIEAPSDEAAIIFYNRFSRNPHRVTCTCCGEDYSLTESATLARATGFERNCKNLETPRDPVTGLYRNDLKDEWFQAHYYLEPEDEAEAVKRGWTVEERRWSRGDYQTVEQYIARADVLVIRANEIKASERIGALPAEGYVWAGADD